MYSCVSYFSFPSIKLLTFSSIILLHPFSWHISSKHSNMDFQSAVLCHWCQAIASSSRERNHHSVPLSPKFYLYVSRYYYLFSFHPHSPPKKQGGKKEITLHNESTRSLPSTQFFPQVTVADGNGNHLIFWYAKADSLISGDFTSVVV